MFGVGPAGESVLDEFERVVDKAFAAETALDAVRLSRLAERVECLRLRAIGHADASGVCVEEGFLSTASWLRERCRVRHERAAGDVAMARRLRRLPATSEAFAAGDIGREHARVMTMAATPAREAAIVDVEEQLVDVARATDPKRFAGVVRHLTDAIDGDGGAGSDEAEHARRHFDLAATMYGRVVGDLGLAADDGEFVMSALDAELRRDRHANDPRTPTQRRADALVAICRRDLERDGATERHGRPHVVVVVDLEHLEGRAPDAVAEIRAEAAHIGAISQSALERLACDASISRVIVDGDSQILDVGRATRTATPAQWAALVVRDRHCQHPGCDRGPGYCDAHHIVHWTRQGPTDLDNLVMLCWEHHRQRHLDTAHHRRTRRRE